MRERALRCTILLVVSGIASLAAQAPALEQVPTLRGVPHDTVAEAARIAEIGPGSNVRSWRVPAPIEQIFRMYRRSLEAQEGPPSDSVQVPGWGSSPVTYHIVYHRFDDECIDPPVRASPDSTIAECNKWRRGRDKDKTFSRSRAQDANRMYVETCIFTWYRRDENKQLARLRVVLEDIGLQPDWKRYTAVTRLTIESAPVTIPTAPVSVDSTAADSTATN
jgi:hypothetical protein